MLDIYVKTKSLKHIKSADESVAALEKHLNNLLFGLLWKESKKSKGAQCPTKQFIQFFEALPDKSPFATEMARVVNELRDEMQRDMDSIKSSCIKPWESVKGWGKCTDVVKQIKNGGLFGTAFWKSLKKEYQKIVKSGQTDVEQSISSLSDALKGPVLWQGIVSLQSLESAFQEVPLSPKNCELLHRSVVS